MLTVRERADRVATAFVLLRYDVGAVAEFLARARALPDRHNLSALAWHACALRVDAVGCHDGLALERGRAPLPRRSEVRP